jgi:hypothetical protein
MNQILDIPENIKQFSDYYSVPDDFTGVFKNMWNYSINFFKNRKHHREDGPAVIFLITKWQKSSWSWYYKGVLFGHNNDFTNESWIEKVKELKHEEELKIFI